MSDQPAETAPNEGTAREQAQTAADASIAPDVSIAPDGPTAPDAPAPAASIAPGGSAPTATPAKPRVRSGAIAWGLIVCATAILLLTVAGVPANAAAFGAWTASLTVASIVIIGVIVLGAFIVLMAVLSLIRRAQRRAARV